MDETKFWAIMEGVTQLSDKEEQCQTLQADLAKLQADEIIAFQAFFDKVIDSAFTWDLWGAAHTIAGKCSNEEFLDFRCWLVSKGKEIYDKALTDADCLAEVVCQDEECFFDALLYVPFEAWSEKTGRGIDDFPESRSQQPEEPIGEEWKAESDDLAKRLPKLTAKFAK